MNDLNKKVYSSITKLSAIIVPLWHKNLASLEISPSQAEVLTLLEKGDANINKIACAMGVTSSAATQLVEALEKKTLVTRTHASSDRRIVIVSMTNNGKILLRKILNLQKKLINSLLQNLESDELKKLYMLHEKMIVAVQDGDLI